VADGILFTRRQRKSAMVTRGLALTREPATRPIDFSRRIDARMVVALALGLEAGAIKTERYGA
jgi:hypothetical protein